MNKEVTKYTRWLLVDDANLLPEDIQKELIVESQSGETVYKIKISAELLHEWLLEKEMYEGMNCEYIFG